MMMETLCQIGVIKVNDGRAVEIFVRMVLCVSTPSIKIVVD